MFGILFVELSHGIVSLESSLWNLPFEVFLWNSPIGIVLLELCLWNCAVPSLGNSSIGFVCLELSNFSQLSLVFSHWGESGIRRLEFEYVKPLLLSGFGPLRS